MKRDHAKELANVYDALAESVVEASDDTLLEESFEEWWESKGLDGDNPSAFFTPADDYSKFDLCLMAYKAGFQKAGELRRKFKAIADKAREASQT